MMGKIDDDHRAMNAVTRVLEVYFSINENIKASIKEKSGALDGRKIIMASIRSGITPENAVSLARRGNEDAKLVVHEFVRAHISSGAPIPDPLKQYAIDFFNGDVCPPKKTGTNESTFDARNFGITIAVDGLIKVFGYKKTRSGAKNESACSIVSLALEGFGIRMSEDAVRKIFDRTKRLIPSIGAKGQRTLELFSANASNENDGT